MHCKSCKGKSIKTRTNYPHGKKSRSVTSCICKACGCTDMEAEMRRGRRFRR